MQNQITTIARTWIGTPYHHQASIKQVGTDCLGLIIGIYRELYNQAPHVPNYSSDWAEATGIETMLNGAKEYLTEIPITNAQPGDIAIFRLRSHTVAKHAAILMPDNKMIHAMEGTPVTEVHLTNWWQRRIAATFRFPTIDQMSTE